MKAYRGLVMDARAEWIPLESLLKKVQDESERQKADFFVVSTGRKRKLKKQLRGLGFQRLASVRTRILGEKRVLFQYSPHFASKTLYGLTTVKPINVR